MWNNLLVLFQVYIGKFLFSSQKNAIVLTGHVNEILTLAIQYVPAIPVDLF